MVSHVKIRTEIRNKRISKLRKNNPKVKIIVHGIHCHLRGTSQHWSGASQLEGDSGGGEDKVVVLQTSLGRWAGVGQ